MMKHTNLTLFSFLMAIFNFFATDLETTLMLHCALCVKIKSGKVCDLQSWLVESVKVGDN